MWMCNHKKKDQLGCLLRSDLLLTKIGLKFNFGSPYIGRKAQLVLYILSQQSKVRPRIGKTEVGGAHSLCCIDGSGAETTLTRNMQNL